MSNVRIDIAAVWKGTQAFNKAFKATKKLDNSVTKLGKSFATLFAAQKVYSFGKSVATAFMEDQKSAAILSNTVKNLGLSFADLDIKKFIDQLSLTAGVIDDELRPAMQKLLTTTGSVAKSQDLLKTAIDVSRASGVDLQTVASDIANAYVGNNRGLKKYALGLSAAELKTASFDKVLQAFNRNFSGANAAYLKTYAGQITAVSVAADQAKETIGKGLIDAYRILAGDKTFDNLSTKINDLAQNIGDFFRGLAQGWKDLANMPVIKQLLELAGVMLKIISKVGGGLINPFIKSGAALRNQGVAGYTATSHLAELSAASNAKAQAAAEAAAAKRAKQLKAAQDANTKALKDQAKLKKQSALFDMEQIQLVAALKGKLSNEERDRVLLQLAILQGNEEEAARLSARIADSIDQTGKLKAYLLDLQNVGDPFAQWVKSLQEAARLMAQMNGGGAGGNTQLPPTSTPINPPQSDKFGWEGLLPNIASSNYGGSAGTITDASSFAGVIKVVIDGKEIASALQDQSLSGNNTTVYRNRGAFNVL